MIRCQYTYVTYTNLYNLYSENNNIRQNKADFSDLPTSTHSFLPSSMIPAFKGVVFRIW